MSTAASPSQPAPKVEEQIVDLRNPLLAAGLALVWPGLGHLYQRRTGKGLLLMVCILGTYFYGWVLGGGKVTYFAWNPKSMRHYGYLCQFWVGLPAWPALIQATNRAPLGENFMTPPRIHGLDDGRETITDLSIWYRQYGSRFELGGVLTMIAGLLNVLAIFDAAAGPIGASPAPDDKKPPPGKPPDGTK